MDRRDQEGAAAKASGGGESRFYVIFALLEGSFLILAVAAYFLMHESVPLLIGSIVVISLVSSTFLLPRILSARRSQE